MKAYPVASPGDIHTFIFPLSETREKRIAEEVRRSIRRLYPGDINAACIDYVVYEKQAFVAVSRHKQTTACIPAAALMISALQRHNKTFPLDGLTKAFCIHDGWVETMQTRPGNKTVEQYSCVRFSEWEAKKDIQNEQALEVHPAETLKGNNLKKWRLFVPMHTFGRIKALVLCVCCALVLCAATRLMNQQSEETAVIPSVVLESRPFTTYEIVNELALCLPDAQVLSLVIDGGRFNLETDGGDALEVLNRLHASALFDGVALMQSLPSKTKGDTASFSGELLALEVEVFEGPFQQPYLEEQSEGGASELKRQLHQYGITVERIRMSGQDRAAAAEFSLACSPENLADFLYWAMQRVSIPYIHIRPGSNAGMLSVTLRTEDAGKMQRIRESNDTDKNAQGIQIAGLFVTPQPVFSEAPRVETVLVQTPMSQTPINQTPPPIQYGRYVFIGKMIDAENREWYFLKDTEQSLVCSAGDDRIIVAHDGALLINTDNILYAIERYQS